MNRSPHERAVFPTIRNNLNFDLKMNNRRTVHPAAFLAIALIISAAAAPLARADDAAEIQALKAEIRVMEQKISALEKREAGSESGAPVAAAPAAPAVAPVAGTATVTVNDSGLVATAIDHSGYFHVGGIAQFDSRMFVHDGGGVLNNGFILRRARIVTDGTFDKIYSFQFTPEFGNGSGGTANAFTILDANITIALTPQAQLKVGKFKTPIGLEELQADPSTNFAERSLVNNLMPNRDVGAMVGGALFSGTVNYTVGLMNGIADSTTSSGNSDFDNDKDGVARIFLTPFFHEKDSVWQGLGVGISGSDGRQKGLSGVTAGFKTDGQQTFFKYNSTVFADGQVLRLSPQAYYYSGPFGVLGEYAVSILNARPTAPAGTTVPAKTQLENKAWEVSAGYVLTGEDSTYAGVTPKAPFNWQNGTWGAWQAVARYSDLKIDPKTFPLFASPLSNAAEARAAGVGVNWYLTKAVRITQDYFQTSFSNNAGPVSTSQILRQDEKAFITRVQIVF